MNVIERLELALDESKKVDEMVKSILALELALDESKKVDEMVRSILAKEGGLDDEYVEVVLEEINALPQVKRSPNGRDAIYVAKWCVSDGTENFSPEDAPRIIGAILKDKDKFSTTKNISLDKLFNLCPSYYKLDAFIDDESKKIVNGAKDDISNIESPDNLSDEERTELIRKELGKPTLSVPGEVDVYRADNKRQSIRYSMGYGWCIGYTNASNQFDYYRGIGNGTAYFCFFKEPQKGYHDIACVIHAMDDDEYRMTNAENDNGSPVVDKEIVLQNYPALSPIIDKMVVVKKNETYLDRELSKYEVDEPLPLEFLCPGDDLENALETGYSAFDRSELRQVLMNDVILSDDLFEFILKHFEHGKVDVDDKDNLIGIYLRLANHPLTSRQRELLKSSKQILKYYDKLFNSKLLAKQREVFEAVEKDKETEDLYVIQSDYHFYTGIPDISLDAEGDVYVMPECSDLDGLPYGRGWNYLEIVNNSFLERAEGIQSYSSVYFEKCPNLRNIEVTEVGSLSVYECGKLQSITVDSWRADMGMEAIRITNLPFLTKLDVSAVQVIDEIRIDECPKLKLNISELLKHTEVGELYIDGERIDLSDLEDFEDSEEEEED